MSAARPSGSRLRAVLAYGAMVAVASAIFLWIRAAGADLTSSLPPPAAPARAPAGGGSALGHVLLSLALITLATRAVGALFRRFLGQPPVMGEIVAGLLLGPSLLGAISPAAQAFVLPADAAPILSTISRLGVVLFLFLVGLDLDPRLLRRQPHATVAISHASILAPFLLGATLALWLYPTHAPHGVDFTVFTLFMGVAMSITAFPVLARILADTGLSGTALGTTALACAAVDDVTAWTLLAFLVGIAKAEVEHAWRTLGLLLFFAAAMVWLVRPLAARFAARIERTRAPLSRTNLALVLACVLLSAVATEAIGVHALFGAFLLGALMPHEGRLASELRERMESIVVVLLLPCFFALTGMRMEIGLLDSARDWLACALVIALATLGKLGGTTVAARLTGHEWRPALALGFLMNTRGLMQLIVLDLGLELGLISSELFAMMVLMALVTTFLAAPALGLVLGERAPAAADRYPGKP